MQELTKYDKKVSLLNWTIPEFVTSVKWQKNFEEYFMNGNLNSRIELLSKLIGIMEEYSHELYK